MQMRGAMCGKGRKALMEIYETLGPEMSWGRESWTYALRDE